jgi:hypothetical protein
MLHILLRKVPEPGLGADIMGDIEELSEEEEEKLYCVECANLVTTGHWRISVNGDHEHTVFNPAGMLFEVLCFKEAPGARDHGPQTREFTWFPGTTWRIALCRLCGRQLGWRYTGAERPRVFFGLIRQRLTSRAPHGTV